MPLTLRTLRYAQPRLQLVANRSGEAVVLQFAIGSWIADTTAAALSLVLTVPQYRSLAPGTVRLAWQAGGTQDVELDEQYLYGGGGMVELQATDEMLESIRSATDTLSTTLVVSVEEDMQVSVVLCDICLLVWCDGEGQLPAVEPDAKPLGVSLMRCRYQGERESDPFVLAIETMVAQMAWIDQQLYLMDSSDAEWSGAELSSWWRHLTGVSECVAAMQTRR